MHIKEIYVIFIHLFDSGILLIIDSNKKKGKKGGDECYLNKCYVCPKGNCGCQYFILLTLRKKKVHGHRGPGFFLIKN
jgi:hypothetical protein